MNKPISTSGKITKSITSIASAALLLFSANSLATVTFEKEIKVTDSALYFDGDKKTVTQARNEAYVPGQKYSYVYGRPIVPHGDAVKVYKDYVFLTWYRGGLLDRHMMLTRYNLKTGAKVDIEFPHQHTGFEGRWWVGETHNTIAVGISPKDETIHLLFDMHAYSPGKDTGGNGSFKNDYFRYAYSIGGAATVADEDFTLAQFVKDTGVNADGLNDYNHVTMTGVENVGAFQQLTYPSFFLNDQNDLFMHMRQGTSYDGSIVFNRYLPDHDKWTNFQRFNVLKAGEKGEEKNWSIYGSMKYQDGKIRIGYQRRFNIPDKFHAQDGMYYAYSDDPTGATDWKNYKGELITMPLVKADETLVFDPSDLLPGATARDQVSVTGGHDWAVTDNGDVHIIGRTRERVNGKYVQEIYSHHYQVGGEGDFITTTDFPSAAQIYAAGENLYIIGLDNNRPFIEQAKGGTNDFTRVYPGPNTNAPTDKTFTHGKIYIHDGKVYYYLLNETNVTPIPDKRTTYLQIIDLNLVEKGANPTIAFAEISTTAMQGYSALKVEINASPSKEQSIKNVSLYVDDVLVSTDDTAPYQWDQTSTALQTLTVGAHTLKAVVTDSADLTAEVSTSMSVIDGMPTISLTQAPLVVTEGYEALSLIANVSSPDAARTFSNVALFLNDELVTQDDSTPFEWTQADAKLQGLVAGTYTVKAVVTDSANLTAETSLPLTVKEKSVEPETKPVPEDKVTEPVPENQATPEGNSDSGGGTFTMMFITMLTVLVSRRKLK